MTWGQTSAGCPRIFTSHTNFVRIREKYFAQGLISEAEHAATRQRILNEM